MSGDVVAEVDAGSGIAIVWIDNPHRRNAMSVQMWDRLAQIFDGLAHDRAVRVIALRGVDGNFSAGADLSEFGEYRRGAETLVYDRRTEAALAMPERLTVPVVAWVEGYCLGGGVSIATACDLVFALKGSRFQIPAARIGTAYPDGALERLADRIGTAHALRMIATAASMDEDEALRVGLVTEVFATPEDLASRLGVIASLAPRSIAAAKASLHHRLSDEERSAIFSSHDYEEGLRAFAERRAPRFQGI